LIKSKLFIIIVNDNGNANITVFSIVPASGPRGTTFSIDFTYVSTNGTGTGEIVVAIHCPDRIPLEGAFLLEAKKPGTYSERITVKAEPDPRCDPTQGKILLIPFFKNIYLLFSLNRTM
jgi:hypothetical protein